MAVRSRLVLMKLLEPSAQNGHVDVSFNISCNVSLKGRGRVHRCVEGQGAVARGVGLCQLALTPCQLKPSSASTVILSHTSPSAHGGFSLGRGGEWRPWWDLWKNSSAATYWGGVGEVLRPYMGSEEDLSFAHVQRFRL